MRLRSIALAAGVAIALCGLALPAASASAHNVVIETTPSAGETLTALPEAFEIVTNEALLSLEGGHGFALQIRDAAGLYYGDGCVDVVDNTMSADPALGAPGAYTVLWQAVSADGHTIDGTIPFTWAPEGEVEPSPGLAEAPVCGQAQVSATATAAPEPSATAQPSTASGVDLGTVLWVGGALLALGLAAAIAIWFASRKRIGG
jgi:methionine-rich copper-binding protein CopC